MKFIKPFFLCVQLFFVNSFTLSRKLRYETSVKTFEFVDYNSPMNKIITIKENFLKKTRGFSRLIRPTNILPTIVLGTTGGWMMNPNLLQLIKSRSFIAANMVVLFIMSNSMILNDIFDMSIDKLNNPTRPLVTGEVTIKESVGMSMLLFAMSELLNFKYIPNHLRIIPHIANLIIVLYTPILKRIPLVKNLSCAFLVSITVLFTGLSIGTNDIMISSKIILLSLVTQLIFSGSLYNELLLDITDISGDKQNGIYTIPVLFGEFETLKMVANITILNIIWCVFNMIHIFNIKQGIVLFMLYFPLLRNLQIIKDSNCSKYSIQQSVKGTIKPMVITLFYFCFLSRYL